MIGLPHPVLAGYICRYDPLYNRLILDGVSELVDFVSPEMNRPLPLKLLPNTGQGVRRKLGKTIILTSTPEKDALEEETKKRKIINKKKTTNMYDLTKED